MHVDQRAEGGKGARGEVQEDARGVLLSRRGKRKRVGLLPVDCYDNHISKRGERYIKRGREGGYIKERRERDISKRRGRGVTFIVRAPSIIRTKSPRSILHLLQNNSQ